jgi:phytoene dehydrogenase-like protein
VSARHDTIVIGAGANGLVAAAVLARAGRKVTVLESAPDAGGQSRLLEFAPGFRAAPLGLDPGWLPDPVARDAGIERLETVAADTPLSVPAGAGRFLTLSREPGRSTAAVREWSEKDAAVWPGFLERLGRLAGFLSALYVVPAIDVDAKEPGELLTLADLGRRFRGLGREAMIGLLRTLPMSAWELMDDTFETAPLKAAIAAGGMQDVRQGPRSGATSFALLHHLVGAPLGSVRGRVPHRGGPAAFSDAAAAAARGAGATLRFGATVERIVVKNDAVNGIVLANGEEIAASYLVSTADPARTLLEWVDPAWLDPEFAHAVHNIRHRGSTAYVLYALDTAVKFGGLDSSALAGTVSLSASLEVLERAADAAKYATVPERPHVEITMPTLLWPDLAPAGKHVMIARVQHVPYRLREGAWDERRSRDLDEHVEKVIADHSPGFGSHVRGRRLLTPADLEREFGLREGAASQGEIGLDQILFMRPVAGWGRHATPISGLYLGGAGTHPGPGVIGGAGWLAARRMLSDARRGVGRPS